jgi:SAM-dependent methyltransferase
MREHADVRVAEGSATVQAELWGERAADWAAIAEQDEQPWLGPAYELALGRLAIGPGSRVLDVGCGAGRFCRLAADRGARIAGLDATRQLVAIARGRVPEADLRVGDLQFLPFADASFDAVTGFNSFFYAADIVAAFREAARVLRPGGGLALTAFGRPQECQSAPVLEYLAPLLPQFAVEDDPALHEAGVLERLLAEAGLAATDAGYLKIAEEHPDLETLLREWLSVGPVRLAVRNAGEEAVRRAVVEALAASVARDGSVRIVDEYRYVLATHAVRP